MKCVQAPNAAKLAAESARLHITSGGDSDSELKELTVKPANSPLTPRVVMTVTPVTKFPNALRRSVESIVGSVTMLSKILIPFRSHR